MGTRFYYRPKTKFEKRLITFKKLYPLNAKMKFLPHSVLILVSLLTSFNGISQKRAIFKPKEIYKSDSLVITQLSENSFEHTSYLQTNDFGNVPCNGLIVRNGSEVIIFDTPTSNETSAELISWIKETLHGTIKAIIPTHFHNDCLAGLTEFHKNNISSYASFKTIELAKVNGYTVPANGFADSLVLNVGTEKVSVRFFGEGHTKDNVVGYFASEHVLFGGCLIKEVGASKGYLGDANVAAWSGTVEKIKQAYPNVNIIVPGHGECGSQKLLDYTIKLFKIR
jgi:metallo-beta-lactamase class B